jgi:sugar phosphate isomerase/epimerase
MPTLLELETLEENVRLCKTLGLDFIEINMNMPQFQPEVLVPAQLMALQRQYGVAFTFHLAEDIDVGHFNQGIRHAYFDNVEAALKLMLAVGSPLLNMHVMRGIHFTLPSGKRYLYAQYRDTYMANLRAFRKRAEQVLSGAPMKIVIENTGDFDHTFLCEGVESLLESPIFALTHDIGHDAISSGGDTAFMEQHEAAIVHYHIHDALDGRDHLTLYEGALPIDAYLQLAARKNASAVVEVKTIEALRQSVERMRFRGYLTSS